MLGLLDLSVLLQTLSVATLSSVTYLLVLVGIVRLRDGLRDRYPVEDYLDLFDLAAHQIHQGLQAASAEQPSKMNKIIIGRYGFWVASGELAEADSLGSGSMFWGQLYLTCSVCFQESLPTVAVTVSPR